MVPIGGSERRKLPVNVGSGRRARIGRRESLVVVTRTSHAISTLEAVERAADAFHSIRHAGPLAECQDAACVRLCDLAHQLRGSEIHEAIESSFDRVSAPRNAAVVIESNLVH